MAFMFCSRHDLGQMLVDCAKISGCCFCVYRMESSSSTTTTLPSSYTTTTLIPVYAGAFNFTLWIHEENSPEIMCMWESFVVWEWSLSCTCIYNKNNKIQANDFLYGYDCVFIVGDEIESGSCYVHVLTVWKVFMYRRKFFASLFPFFLLLCFDYFSALFYKVGKI